MGEGRLDYTSVYHKGMYHLFYQCNLLGATLQQALVHRITCIDTKKNHVGACIIGYKRTI